MDSFGSPEEMTTGEDVEGLLNGGAFILNVCSGLYKRLGNKK